MDEAWEGDLGISLPAPSSPRREHSHERWRSLFPRSPPPQATCELLSRFVLAFALVDFDLDQGPVLRETYPPLAHGDELAMRSACAFASLPDGASLPTQSPLSGQQQQHQRIEASYWWRVPWPAARERATAASASTSTSNGTASTSSPTTTTQDGSASHSSGMNGETLGRLNGSGRRRVSSTASYDEDARRHLCGFVYFAMDKDSSSRRGYHQRALVLLSPRVDLVGLLSHVATATGRHFFATLRDNDLAGGRRSSSRSSRPDKGASAEVVETACHNIAAWPDFAPGVNAEVPFFGNAQGFHFALAEQARMSALHASPSILSASLPATSLCEMLSAAPTTMIGSATSRLIAASGRSTGMSRSPSTGSVAASSSSALALGLGRLVLLWELILLGEPVLLLAQTQAECAAFVAYLVRLIDPIAYMGDFRPYFHIHDGDYRRLTRAPRGTILGVTNPQVARACVTATSADGRTKAWPHVVRLAGAPAESAGAMVAPGAPGSTASRPELVSPRRRHVKKDERLEREIDAACVRKEYRTADRLVGRYLASLTERFLAPLNRYSSTLLRESNPLKGAGGKGAFDRVAFLSSLAAHGTPLEFRSAHSSSKSVARFYEAFMLRSVHFERWARERSAQQWLARIERADVRAWLDADVGAAGRRGQGGEQRGTGERMSAKMGKRELDDLARMLDREARLSDSREGRESLTSPGGKVVSRGARLRFQAERVRSFTRSQGFLSPKLR